jgi:hypothetical protein
MTTNAADDTDGRVVSGARIGFTGVEHAAGGVAARS